MAVNTIKIHRFTMHMQSQQLMANHLDVLLVGLQELVVAVVITAVPLAVVVSIPTEEAVATAQEDYLS